MKYCWTIADAAANRSACATNCEGIDDYQIWIADGLQVLIDHLPFRIGHG